MDDAWIHQVVARTFAETGSLGFAPEQYGAAATSHLWAALLALNYLVVHADPSIFALCINVSLSLATGQLLLVALRRPRKETADGDDPWSRHQRDLNDLLAVAFGCAGGNFLWFAYSGMEASLVAFLALAAIVAYGEPGARPRRSALAAGLFAGLLAVARPECMLFGPALAVATWVLPRKRQDAVFFLAPWVLLAGAWLLVNQLKTGDAIPPTLAGRRWLWQHGNLGLSKFVLLREFASTLALRLRNYTLGTSSTLAFWTLVGLSTYGLARLCRRRSWTIRLIIAWGIIHLGIYALLLPTPGHGGRYQPLTPLLFLLGGGYGALYLGEQVAWLIGSKSGRAFYQRRALLAVASLSPWVGLVAVGVRDWRHDHACAVSHIRWTELGMAEEINRLPPEAKVASFDIGGIGFASTRPILDIGGLSDPTTARYLNEGRLWALFRERAIDYVVLPVSYREDLPDPMNFGRRLRLFENPGLELELVSYRESPFSIWAPGIAATWNSSPRQALYHVHDTGKPGLITPTRVKGDESVLLSDPGHTLVRPERDMLLYGLRRFSAEGIPVALTISPMSQEEPSRLPGTWQIILGAWGVQVARPAAAGPEIRAEVARAAIAEAVRPYAEIGDFGGGARIALYALANVVRGVDPSFSPLMAPVRGPDARGGSDDVRESLGTGALIIAGIAFFMMAVEKRRLGAFSFSLRRQPRIRTAVEPS